MPKLNNVDNYSPILGEKLSLECPIGKKAAGLFSLTLPPFSVPELMAFCQVDSGFVVNTIGYNICPRSILNIRN